MQTLPSPAPSRAACLSHGPLPLAGLLLPTGPGAWGLGDRTGAPQGREPQVSRPLGSWTPGSSSGDTALRPGPGGSPPAGWPSIHALPARSFRSVPESPTVTATVPHSEGQRVALPAVSVHGAQDTCHNWVGGRLALLEPPSAQDAPTENGPAPAPAVGGG